MNAHVDTAAQVRGLVEELRTPGSGLHHANLDLALAPLYDDDRAWELITERVSDTVSRPMVRTLTTFLG